MKLLAFIGICAILGWIFGFSWIMVLLILIGVIIGKNWA